MKKIILTTLAALFMLVSCDVSGDSDERSTNTGDSANTGDSTSFVGTWKADLTDSEDGDYTLTYTFTSSSFTSVYIYADDSSNDSYTKGTLSASSGNLVLTVTEISSDGTTWSTPAEYEALLKVLYQIFLDEETAATMAAAAIEEMTEPTTYAYSVSGTTLTLSGTAFTAQ